MLTFLGIPFLALLVILQSSIVSRLNIAYGQADLVMLFVIAWALQERNQQGLWWALCAAIMMSIASAIPLYIYLAGYLSITVIAILARKRLWNIPLMTMVVLSFMGTVLVLMLSFFYIRFTQVDLPFVDSLVQIVIPSAALNMLFGIPIFFLVKDLVPSLYPPKEYV
jgi:hypothetical protein